MAAAHAARLMLAGTCATQLAWHHQMQLGVRCSPYIVSASSSFSRSALACPDSADRLTLVLQRNRQSKAWGSSACNMAKPASSCCLCPAGADASRRHGRRRPAHRQTTPTACRLLVCMAYLSCMGMRALSCSRRAARRCSAAARSSCRADCTRAANSGSLGPAGSHS